MTLLVVAAMLAISMAFDAPLVEQANPGMSPNPTKAPWYFMGFQEILMHFHPLIAALVIPALLTLGLFLLPYLRYEQSTAGVWFCSRTGRRTAALAAAVAMVGTVSAVLLDDMVLAADAANPPTLVRNGLLPLLAVSAFCAGFHVLVRKAFGANRNEAVQALFTLLMVSFVILTLIGNVFRGPGMQLYWGG